eukprot:CAMPEP_0180289150 /NCGR_PEP_ID=MMETSP0988-20121125/14535_1 /TAXON_ID=697907 /ORGANISM="non described non described, Strain CCMP2293" /LENGTH=138 /DNA_ID=CAMNT_0022264089 /DNA_START=8 /DNA_END=424 /DNA_ORIENTATION=+
MAGGVGIYLARKVNGEYMVTLVTPNGPAALSGAVLPGDILLEVDGWPVENMDPQQVHESIVGHPGNICTLLLSSFANDGFNKVVRLARREGYHFLRRPAHDTHRARVVHAHGLYAPSHHAPYVDATYVDASGPSGIFC